MYLFRVPFPLLPFSPLYPLAPISSASRRFAEPKLESEAAADADDLYLIGLLIGLAIYNGVILDCPLPLALYKKLLHANNPATH